jgi:NAD(P)H dehydrogenase (quinone)
MTSVLVVYYSSYGHIEAMARAQAEGAARVPATRVVVKRVAELVPPEICSASGFVTDQAAVATPDELEHYDAIIFGTPTRFGSPASELRAYIDTLGGVWFQGKLCGKAGGAFGATGTRHGGNESTLLTLYNTFAHLGMIIVPTGYADPAMFKAGTPYGATAVVAPNGAPTEDELAAARYQGRRVTEIAAALVAAKPSA